MLNLDISQIFIQIIAFLVMLWVMKRYGWQPLMDILDTRKKTIQAEFDSLAAQKKQANQWAAQYEEKLKNIESEARQRIQEAVAEGRKISLEIQDHAQSQAKEIIQKAQSEIEGDIAKAKNQLKKDMINLIIHTTEKILQEKLDEPNQKTLITHFVEQAELK